MNDDLIDPHRGKVATFQAGPAPTLVERNENSRLGPDVQDVRVLDVLGDRADILALQVADDGPEGLAVVRAHPDIRVVVVQQVVVDRDVYRTDGITRGHHIGDEAVLRTADEVLRDVRPRLAAVA